MKDKKYPWLQLLFLAFFIIVPSLTLVKLDFNNAPALYLPADQASVKLDKQIRAQFPDDQVAVILFRGDSLYSDEFLDSLQKASKKIQQSPLVERVIDVTEIEHISGSVDGFDVAPLLGESRRKSLASNEARFQYAQKDNVASGAVVAKTIDYMSMVVRPDNLSSTLERMELLAFIEQTLSDYQLKQFVVGYAGAIPVEIAQFKSMIRDSLIFVPGTTTLGLILIWLMFRRILAVVMSAVVSGAVVYTAIMLFVITSTPYTLIAAMIPSFLAALTTAFLIHFYNSLQLASSLSLESEARVAYAMRSIRKPVFFTALTTILGLSSLAISPIPPIVHFGLIAAAGVAFLTFILLVILPGVFSALDKTDWPKSKKNRSIIDRVLKKILGLSVRKAGWVVAVSVLLLLLGVPFILQIKAETNLLEFFQEEHEITTSTQMVEDHLTGVMSLEIELYGDSRDSFKKSAHLLQMEQLKHWLEQQPEIDKVSSIVGIVKDMHRAMHENKPDYYKIPGNDALISQYFFIYDGSDAYDLVNREFDHARILMSVNEHTSSQLTLLIKRISQYLEQNSQGLKWDIAGEARLFADQDELLITGQINSLIVAIGLIFLVMYVLWRDLLSTILTMIPNLSPIVAIFILMGISGIKLDMATAMIASVAIGIAVDDTIHLFHAYKTRRDHGSSNLFALVQSYYKTGRALVITTIILCAQFSLLGFSQFIPTSNFGILTSMGLFMALIFDLVLLPSLLVLIYRNRAG